MGENNFDTTEIFVKTFISRISKCLKLTQHPDLQQFWLTDYDVITTFDQLSDKISDLCQRASQPVVMLIDEVDKSADNQTFLDFLGMLRNKYLDREIAGPTSTFRSVVLASVHDVKNLKLKIRPDDERKYNSPWNIAAEFKVDMAFNPLEISTMLADYESHNPTGMDIMALSNAIYKYTSGYPFLVSKICKIIDEELNRDWTEHGVQLAIAQMLNDNNISLFKQLIKYLANNKDFKNFIYSIAVQDIEIPFNPYEDNIDFGTMYSIVKPNSTGKVMIHNLIFERLIYDYFITSNLVQNSIKRVETKGKSGKINST